MKKKLLRKILPPDTPVSRRTAAPRDPWDSRQCPEKATGKGNDPLPPARASERASEGRAAWEGAATGAARRSRRRCPCCCCYGDSTTIQAGCDSDGFWMGSRVD